MVLETWHSPASSLGFVRNILGGPVRNEGHGESHRIIKSGGLGDVADSS